MANPGRGGEQRREQAVAPSPAPAPAFSPYGLGILGQGWHFPLEEPVGSARPQLAPRVNERASGTMEGRARRGTGGREPARSQPHGGRDFLPTL